MLAIFIVSRLDMQSHGSMLDLPYLKGWLTDHGTKFQMMANDLALNPAIQ
jgi:hypothetical protein